MMLPLTIPPQPASITRGFALSLDEKPTEAGTAGMVSTSKGSAGASPAMYESSTLAVRRPPLALYGAGQEKLAAAEKRLTEESEVWKCGSLRTNTTTTTGYTTVVWNVLPTSTFFGGTGT